MRIVQVITRPQRRGAEIFTCQLSEQLAKLSHELILVSLFKGQEDLFFAGTFIRLNIENESIFSVKVVKALVNVFLELKPDIVQANASHTLRVCVFAKWMKKSDYKLVYRNANLMSDFIRFEIQNWVYGKLLSSTDGIASVSFASKNDLINTFKLKNQKIEVLYIGLDLDVLRNLSCEKDEFLLPNPFILQLGSLVSEKNPLGLLSMFHDLEDSELALLIMGSGPLKDALFDKKTELNLIQKVHFLPNQPNPFPILKQAKALVMPSTIEGLPAVILEAMALRIPVIAYGVGGIPEVLTEQTGYCVPPGNTQAFIQAIKTCLSSDNTTKLDAAQQLVLEHYTIEKVAKQFEEFYEEVLSRKARNTRK